MASQGINDLSLQFFNTGFPFLALKSGFGRDLNYELWIMDYGLWMSGG
jgi:hypothetical protein